MPKPLCKALTYPLIIHSHYRGQSQKIDVLLSLTDIKCAFKDVTQVSGIYFILRCIFLLLEFDRDTKRCLQ